jgi:hypothetical protein
MNLKQSVQNIYWVEFFISTESICWVSTSYVLKCKRCTQDVTYICMNTAEKRLRMCHHYWNRYLYCERGVKSISEPSSEIRKTSCVPKVFKNSKWKRQGSSDFGFLPFLWKCKRNNERDNPKTRNNYSLQVQEVLLCKKINQRWLSINSLYNEFRYPIFKANDLLYNIIVCKCLTIR